MITEAQLNEFRQFETAYIQLRKQEGRLFDDEQVKNLPDLPVGHPLYKEWKIRKISTDRFIRYIQKKQKPLKILDIGCGNGWLAYKLSLLDEIGVTGIDINKQELQQARRLFYNGQLNFFYSSPECLDYTEQFDIILFAASFQYFSEPEQTLSACARLLQANGEIHILDSFFYEPVDHSFAQEQSRFYFQRNHAQAMNEYYFHHTYDCLHHFQLKLLYDPGSLLDRLLYKHPFPWVRLTQKRAI